MCVGSLQTLANVLGKILEVGTSGEWRWPVGVEISPTDNFMLWNLSMDILDGIKAIHR